MVEAYRGDELDAHTRLSDDFCLSDVVLGIDGQKLDELNGVFQRMGINTDPLENREAIKLSCGVRGCLAMARIEDRNGELFVINVGNSLDHCAEA